LRQGAEEGPVSEGRLLLLAVLGGGTSGRAIARACHVSTSAISALSTGARLVPTLRVAAALEDGFAIPWRAWLRDAPRSSKSTREDAPGVTTAMTGSDGNDSAPNAEMARDFIGADVDANDVRALAQRHARALASQLGVSLKELDATREDIHERMGMTRSKGIRWEGNDRVFGHITKEEAIEILEKNARRGSHDASHILRGIRGRRAP
jgi:transcriptional regulator with XRE-family HTH domain